MIVKINGSDAQKKSVCDFMRIRKIPFESENNHKSEGEDVADIVEKELKKRDMSAMVIVVYESREMKTARVAYVCSDDLDPKAVVDSVLDCVALFAKDKELS